MNTRLIRLNKICSVPIKMCMFPHGSHIDPNLLDFNVQLENSVGSAKNEVGFSH